MEGQYRGYTLSSPCEFLCPLAPATSIEGKKCDNASDVHNFTVVSAEQVEMALLSGLQLNAYYDQRTGTRLNFPIIDESNV